MAPRTVPGEVPSRWEIPLPDDEAAETALWGSEEALPESIDGSEEAVAAASSSSVESSERARLSISSVNGGDSVPIITVRFRGSNKFSVGRRDGEP